MKSKLIAVILSFVVMIAITPLVFSSLMNKKFDEMLKNLEKRGFVIKEIANKSSYLTTDRVFEVVIPGEKIDSSGYVKDVVLKVESIFKNLPVTNVKFLGDVLRVDLLNPQDTQILNKAIKDKIKFLVVTPNFKVYKYKVFDSKIELTDTEVLFKGVSGEFLYPDENNFNLNDFVISSLIQPISFEVKNLSNFYKKKKNTLSYKEKFDFFVNLENGKLSLLDSIINTTLYLDKKLKIISSFSLKSADIFSMLRFSALNGGFHLDGIDKKLIYALKNSPNKRDVLVEIFKRGFKSDANLDIKHVYVSNKDIGFFNLKIDTIFYPDEEFESKLRRSDLSFLYLHIRLKTTPEIATILMNLNPQLTFWFAFAKKDKDIELDLEIKKGKLFVNGEEVKSD